MQTNIKIVIILLVLTVNSSMHSTAQNLILNPGFENGMNNWATNSNNVASANYTIETLDSPEGNKHIKCEIKALGNNAYDVQIRSNVFNVDQTHKYRLTFKAKCETPEAKTIVYIQKSLYMGKHFTLSNSWESYSYEFYPNEAIKQVKFNFMNIANYYIDDVAIEDINPVKTDFNSPPSCIITAPHVNAYFKKGSSVKINAYASDLGGSGINGTVSKVEFYVDQQKIGESSTSVNKTYSFDWNADNTGEYTVNAVATDNLGKSFKSAGVIISVGLNPAKAIGLSAGKGKYLGNIVGNSGAEPSFTNYWNAITSGNGCKWAIVEKNRDVMKWTQADDAYNLAKNNNLAFRYHTLAWGSQYPSWIKTLAPADFQEEMEEFMAAIANRYKYIDQFDVLNEALPGHQEDTKYFINGLGGTGESGYDWAVWLFKKARAYFPNSKLILNDFAIVNSTSNIREQLLFLQVLRDSALVDGFGAQAHTFNLDGMNANNLKQNLDLMATAGVPIYLTEMDMQGVNIDEASQLTSYMNLFPVLWEHPDVAGISLWGYVYGSMWKPDAGLVNADGSERSCMTWLKDYMNNLEDVGYPFADNATFSSDPDNHLTNSILKIYPNPASREATLLNTSNKDVHVSALDIYGRLIQKHELLANSKMKLNLPTGMYLVNASGQETVKLWIKN